MEPTQTLAEPRPAGASDAGERILDAAYELFCTRGVNIVGIDEIIATSGVARQTLYRRFRSKQELVLAVLERREQLWTRGWLQAEVERRADDPDGRLLAIFEVFDGWFRRDDFEGCAFINVMIEHPDTDDPVRAACVGYLAGIREFLAQLATDARIARPEELRPPLAHPDEGLDRLRRRGRRRRRAAGPSDRDARARARAANRLISR